MDELNGFIKIDGEVLEIKKKVFEKFKTEAELKRHVKELLYKHIKDKTTEELRDELEFLNKEEFNNILNFEIWDYINNSDITFEVGRTYKLNEFYSNKEESKEKQEQENKGEDKE